MLLASGLSRLIFFVSALRAQCESVADVLSSKGEFSVLLQALQKSGLDQADALTGNAEVTLFAPTDAAFTSLLEKLGASAEDLLARSDLTNILLLHVAVGQISGSRAAAGAVVQSLEGARLFASTENKTVVVGGAQVLEADISAGKAVVHAINKVLLPPERRLLDGGSSGWAESRWRVTVDGVMGGKSTGNVEFSSGHMIFTGDINLDGGGFSSVRRSYSVDLSSYAGLLVEFEAHAFKKGKAPLGVHLQLGDSTSSYDYSAGFAVPLSSASDLDFCRFFIPMEAFTHASRMGRNCNSCRLNAAAVDTMSFYVLYQSGPFALHMKSIKAVKSILHAPLPTTPSVALDSSAISSLIEASIDSGATVWDKGYPELCIEIYSVALRQIMAAQGPSNAIRDLACAGLQMATEGSINKKGWAMRKAMDAIHDDLGGRDREQDSRYPDYVQGAWLPAPGQESGDSGICEGLADLSTSGKDSTQSADASDYPDVTAAAAADTKESGSVEASLKHFQGPWKGMGITGWNDLGQYDNTSPKDCAEMCLKNSACKSFDYGARGKVAGECWLSTADREKAGSAYEAWSLYDYYERIPHDEKTSAQPEPEPEPEPAALSATSPQPEAPRETLVADTLSSKSEFSTLLKALQTTGLANAAALSGAAEVTVFAPTDDAFGSLLKALSVSAEELLAREDLSEILLLHVAVGQIPGSRAAAGTVVQSLEGARFLATTSEGGVVVDGAKVLEADIMAGKAVVHAIDKVLLPPRRKLVDGGSSGWEESKWRITVDGVMGGKSSGSAEVSSGTMIFTGDINLNGGGFSSVGRSYTLDLSSHAGFLLEFESHIFQSGKAPLGVHFQLGDSKSRYDFSAAFAVPFSASARERCRVFLPKEAFNHASRGGSKCSSCKFSGSVDSMAFYILFQSGQFELRLHSIMAVEQAMHAPLPTAPSVTMDSSGVTALVRAAIDSGAPLYDKGYHGLCIEIYSVAMRQIAAATGPAGTIRALACAGLRMAMHGAGSDQKRAWALRKAMDAIIADSGGYDRKSDSRYPGYVQGSWLPAKGSSGDEGICAGVADLSSSGGDSHASADSLAANNMEPDANGMNAAAPSGDMKVDGFLGPFEGMGISGWNDLQNYKPKSRADCASLCLANPRCRSFDYGARGNVKGECWLSTANREIAGNAYSAWRLYDYYELSSDSVKSGSAGTGNTAAKSSNSKGDDDEDGPGTLTWVLLGCGVLAGVLLGLGVAYLISRCCQRRRKLKGVTTGTEFNANDVVVGQPVFGQPVDDNGKMDMDKKAGA